MMLTMKSKASRKGFTLVELAIVLAVASLLFSGLWRLMASGNTQLRDQSAADQHRQLVSAAQTYLATTEGQDWVAKQAPNATVELPLPSSNDNNADCRADALIVAASVPGFCDYLPVGFTNTTTNSYGQTFAVRVLKDNQPLNSRSLNTSFMVLTSGGDVIPDTSGGRIASMIGNDGGFLYATNVCGENIACGAFGSWTVSPETTYGFLAASVANGHIASRTYAGVNAMLQAPWLARIDVPDSVLASGSHDYNTIQTSISLGDQILYGTGTAGGAVYGGEIQNLHRLIVGRSNATDNAPLTINGNGCSRTGPTDVSCNYLAQINGDQSVTGLLSAARLYAGQFIYDTSSSDIRLKRDVKEIPDALDRLGKIKGYTFIMKDSDKTKYGVIAQEVEKVFPEIVYEMADGYKAVDYMGLIGPLVSAASALKAENEKLQTELQSLAQEVKELKASLPKSKTKRK